MSRHFARQFQTLSVVALFVAIVAILTALSSRAQVHATNGGQASAESSMVSATPGVITLAQVLQRPLPTGDGSARRASGSFGQREKSGAIRLDSGNSLFLPAVTYDTGGNLQVIPLALVVVDVNGDGKPDLVVANSAGAGPQNGWVDVLLGNGDGTFQPALTTNVGQRVGAGSFAVADVNGDGRPDVIIGSCCESNGDTEVAVLLGNGDGTFQAPVFYDAGGTGEGGPGGAVAVADMNGDGNLDIVAVTGATDGSGQNAVAVLFGNGNGTFQPAVLTDAGDDTGCLVIADVNNNGIPDVVVCDENGVGVLLGNGNGTFQPLVVYIVGYCSGSLVVADVTGNGIPGLLVSHSGPDSCGTGGYVGVLLGNGDGTFQPEVNYDSGGPSAGGIAVSDVNLDGKPDVVVANSETPYGAGSIGVLLGNGDGTFQTATSYPTGGENPMVVVAADLNGDGRPDVVASNSYSDTAGVLLNANATTTTLASSPNPSAFGQAVTFTATVSPASGTPTGTVIFYDGSTAIGSATLGNGSAAISVS